MVLGQQYSKIEILQRNGSNINNVNYLNCWYEITNGYFIVSELDLDKESLRHNVHKMDNIHSFKTTINPKINNDK
jgi:hypothetical protein